MSAVLADEVDQDHEGKRHRCGCAGGEAGNGHGVADLVAHSAHRWLLVQ
jgi:hypothetical protein